MLACALLPSPPSGALLPSQERCMRHAAQPAFCKPVCTPGPWCCASLLNNGDKLILETPNKLSLLLLLFHYVQWTGKGWLIYWSRREGARGRVYCVKGGRHWLLFFLLSFLFLFGVPSGFIIFTHTHVLKNEWRNSLAVFKLHARESVHWSDGWLSVWPEMQTHSKTVGILASGKQGLF